MAVLGSMRNEGAAASIVRRNALERVISRMPTGSRLTMSRKRRMPSGHCSGSRFFPPSVASPFGHGVAVLKARSMGRGIGGLGSNVGPLALSRASFPATGT